MDLNTLKSRFSGSKEQFIREWRELLAIQSISADPAFNEDCVRCAEWLVQKLKKIGFSTDLVSTDTKPVIIAELPGDTSRPCVLFYGHYDVQPPDPVELWQSPPFSPEIRNGRMYARGAEDNKGQLFYFICAVEALKEAGVTLPTIKVLIEGEEESGGKALAAGLQSWKHRLGADVLMVCDTGMVSAAIPTITMGLRGIATFEFKLHGPKYDLHSGVFGGIAPNPAQGMARVLATLHNADGSIAVEGFYDGITPMAAEDLDKIRNMPLDPADLAAAIGVPLVGGETALTPWERGGIRPTLEINGLGSGYQGAGPKTIIPSSAFAKITTRLVMGQDGKNVIACVRRHIEKHLPAGLTLEICYESSSGGALSLSTKSKYNQKAAEVLTATFGREPAFHWIGGSIPIIGALAEASGAEAVLVGFGLEEDMIHAPNESFSLDQFEQGFLFCGSFLQAL